MTLAPLFKKICTCKIVSNVLAGTRLHDNNIGSGGPHARAGEDDGTSESGRRSRKDQVGRGMAEMSPVLPSSRLEEGRQALSFVVTHRDAVWFNALGV